MTTSESRYSGPELSRVAVPNLVTQDAASNDEHRAQPLWLAYKRGHYEIAAVLSEHRAPLG